MGKELSAASATRTDQSAESKVFISYSRKDSDFADQLEAALNARSFEVFIDRHDISALKEWWARIETLITKADTIVFVLSPDSVASEYTRKEVAFAASLNKRFAPIVYRQVDANIVPESVRKLNYIFFDDEAKFETCADTLARALRTDIGWIRLHTEFGESARQWSVANRAEWIVAARSAARGSRKMDRRKAGRGACADRGDTNLRPAKPGRSDKAAKRAHGESWCLA